jgi:copper(I)-binding protein
VRSIVLLALLVAAGCGRAQTGGLRVEGAVVGATPAGFDAAVYFDDVTGDRDAIVGAESDDADEVSLHELELVGGGGIMMPADRIELDAGTTSLEPLGSHVMLHDLRRPLEPGGRIEVRLTFDRHPPVSVVVDVVPLEELVELVAR